MYERAGCRNRYTGKYSTTPSPQTAISTEETRIPDGRSETHTTAIFEKWIRASAIKSSFSLTLTLSFPLSPSTSITDFVSKLSDLLSQLGCRITLTKNPSKEIELSSSAHLLSLLSRNTDASLLLRLSVPLCGGKDGFGYDNVITKIILNIWEKRHAGFAGVRMSSRRKKNQGDSNSSNQNLDGSTATNYNWNQGLSRISSA